MLQPWNHIMYIPYENTTHCQMSRFLNQQGYWINPTSYILWLDPWIYGSIYPLVVSTGSALVVSTGSGLVADAGNSVIQSDRGGVSYTGPAGSNRRSVSRTGISETGHSLVISIWISWGHSSVIVSLIIVGWRVPHSIWKISPLKQCLEK